MPRPKKSADELRARWDTLHVTPAERSEIEAAAKAVQLTPSRYLIQLHQGITPRRDRDWGPVLVALVQAERRLETLSHRLAKALCAEEALRIQVHLLGIERSFRRAILLGREAREGSETGEAEE